MLRFVTENHIQAKHEKKRRNASCKYKLVGEKIMKKINLIAAGLAILVMSIVNVTYAGTSKTKFTKWRITIECCPLKIIRFEETNRAVISRNIEIDEKNNFLIASQLEISDLKLDVLSIVENIELSAKQAEQLGYKNFVILSGDYKLSNGKKLSIRFKGEKITTKGNSTQVADLRSIVGNKDNPYDEVGLKHNEIVAEFFKSEEYRSYRESKNKDARTAVENFLIGCCGKNKFCCLNTPGPYNPIPDIGWLIKTVRTEKEPLKILSKLGASKSVEANTKETLSLIKKQSWNKEFTREMFNDFFALEKRIVADRKLTKDDRQKALMILSVARYSLYYWKNFDDNNLPQNRKIDWGEVAAVDTMCAIGGPEAAAAGSLLSALVQAALP